jgi:predicted PurR-regulated permease PerM
MNESHKELITIGMTVSIVVLTVFIVHRFIPSMIWAAIIVVATYPLYKRWRVYFGQHQNIAAFLFTFVLSSLLLVPLSWLVSLLIKELQYFVNYLQIVNREGGQAPNFLQEFPVIGNELIRYWDKNIGQPGSLKQVLSNIHVTLTPASYYIKQVGANLVHRGFQLGFTILTLFFFYRDGDKLLEQINHVGNYCLGQRWFRYANRLPAALRSTVNGTILVGLGVGILMGIGYMLVGLPGPTLAGFITACAAMIPFVVPLVFGVIALILFSSGAVVSAIIIVAWGTFVMFVADHFVKPVMIGGAIKLPFLAVLFGILGGVETLGLLGLFLGPIIMVLFVTLWQEPRESEALQF